MNAFARVAAFYVRSVFAPADDYYLTFRVLPQLIICLPYRLDRSSLSQFHY